MASKTSLLGQVKALDTNGAAASLDESPALLDVRDERGRTWLHVVCSIDVTSRSKADVKATVALASLMVESGLDMSEAAFTEGTWRATPVWYSIGRGRNLALARWLLERGADPDHTLWAASFRNDLDAISLLLDHGADIEAVAEGDTPFLGAIKTSHFDAAWLLAERGANVDFVDAAGMTALHYMLKKGSDAEHFEAISRFRPRVDIPNADGKTAGALLARKRDPALRALAG